MSLADLVGRSTSAHQEQCESEARPRVDAVFNAIEKKGAKGGHDSARRSAPSAGQAGRLARAAT